MDELNVSALIFALFVAAGLGSFPTGLLVAREAGEVDLQTIGSGSIGATNIFRAFGLKWAIVVFMGDKLKGLFAVNCAYALRLPMFVAAAAGVVAVTMHIFNPILRGKGGKGVATSFGVILALSPWTALFALALWGALMAWKRIVSLASLAAAASLPLAMTVFTWTKIYRISAIAASVLIAGLVIFAHRENLKRLRRGEEKPPARAPAPPARPPAEPPPARGPRNRPPRRSR